LHAACRFVGGRAEAVHRCLARRRAAGDAAQGGRTFRALAATNSSGRPLALDHHVLDWAAVVIIGRL